MKQKALRYVIHVIAIRISMYTDYSYAKNFEVASAASLFLLLTVIFIFALVLPRTMIVWYVFAAYFVIAAVFSVLILYIFESAARMRFTSKLPQTFKLINSRYISKGNILKAIAATLESGDFDRAVKREMRIILSVLKSNDMSQINRTFEEIEEKYRNEYLTLLLNLIRQAHYKGGNEVIRQQFEATTEDVLLEIENRKDLSSTGRMYVFLAVLMPACIAGIEKFNTSALGVKAAEYYNSPDGFELKLVILIALVLFIGIMFFMEKSV
jgi:Flp pilus assembly protein TadB